MWLQDDGPTGPIHRLLVMERGASTDAPALELASVALPSPSVAFSFAEDDGLLSFGVEGGAEVALAFVADEGAVQVYQDVQAVQGLAGGAPPPGLGLGLGLDAGPHPLELPPPSEATLPEVARLLASWPPHARAAARALVAERADGAAGDDYIGALGALVRRLAPQARGREPAPAAAAALAQLALVYRQLLAHPDEGLLRRLLRADAVAGLFGALEHDEAAGHAQTPHVNVQYTAYLAAPGRFKMPVPIRDATTLARVHMNAHIALLTEAALPSRSTTRWRRSAPSPPTTVARSSPPSPPTPRSCIAADGLRDSAEASAGDRPLAPPPPPGPVATAGAAALAAAAAAAAARRRRRRRSRAGVAGGAPPSCAPSPNRCTRSNAPPYRAADAAGVLHRLPRRPPPPVAAGGAGGGARALPRLRAAVPQPRPLAPPPRRPRRHLGGRGGGDGARAPRRAARRRRRDGHAHAGVGSAAHPPRPWLDGTRRAERFPRRRLRARPL